MKTDGTCWKVGDPIVINGVVGRVTRVDGGLVEMTTPHGSVMSSGMLWVRHPDEAKLRYLDELEFDVKSKPRRTSEVYR